MTLLALYRQLRHFFRVGQGTPKIFNTDVSLCGCSSDILICQRGPSCPGCVCFCQDFFSPLFIHIVLVPCHYCHWLTQAFNDKHTHTHVPHGLVKMLETPFDSSRIPHARIRFYQHTVPVSEDLMLLFQFFKFRSGGYGNSVSLSQLLRSRANLIYAHVIRDCFTGRDPNNMVAISPRYNVTFFLMTMLTNSLACAICVEKQKIPQI